MVVLVLQCLNYLSGIQFFNDIDLLIIINDVRFNSNNVFLDLEELFEIKQPNKVIHHVYLLLVLTLFLLSLHHCECVWHNSDQQVHEHDLN